MIRTALAFLVALSTPALAGPDGVDTSAAAKDWMKWKECAYTLPDKPSKEERSKIHISERCRDKQRKEDIKR